MDDQVYTDWPIPDPNELSPRDLRIGFRQEVIDLLVYIANNHNLKYRVNKLTMSIELPKEDE